jgi:hypothetical protein
MNQENRQLLFLYASQQLKHWHRHPALFTKLYTPRNILTITAATVLAFFAGI